MGIIIPKQIGFEDANPLCSFNGSNIIWATCCYNRDEKGHFVTS